MSAVSVSVQLTVIQISLIQPKFHNSFIYLFSKHAVNSEKTRQAKVKKKKERFFVQTERRNAGSTSATQIL